MRQFSVILVLPKIANIAQRIGLLDQPNGRKVHTRPQPLVGGIGMVSAVIFTSLSRIYPDKWFARLFYRAGDFIARWFP
jgi:UDP-N-acetylmuramyl pentapeptide phosphotransferase/UDP-N-acetylglucosamine-1-phosphate transferase